MFQALLSFIVAALCVQQAVSHPLGRRITGVYIISYLVIFVLVFLERFFSRCWRSQLRAYSWKCILLWYFSQFHSGWFSKCRFASLGPSSSLAGRSPWGGMLPDRCIGRSGHSGLHLLLVRCCFFFEWRFVTDNQQSFQQPLHRR